MKRFLSVSKSRKPSGKDAEPSAHAAAPPVHPDPGKKSPLTIDLDSPVRHPVCPAPTIALSPMKTKGEHQESEDTFTNEERVKLLKELSLRAQGEKVEAAIARVRELCAKELSLIPDSHEEVKGDRRILRFLRGHKYDIGVAAKMYGDMLRWRSENNIGAIRDEILKKRLQPHEFPHQGRVTKFYPSIVHFSDDLQGRPVHIDLIGRLEPKKLLSCFDQDEWMHHHVYCMEYNSIMVDELSINQDKLVRIVSLYDMAGFGLSHLHKPAVELLKKTIRLTQDFYPEMMDQSYVLNTPKMFSVCWSMLKPLLAERTVKKIQILGKNYCETLVEQLGADALPTPMGGTKPHDETPLVFDRADLEVEHEEDYTSLEVAKGTTNKVSIQVEAESFIVWGFYALGGDVGVEIKFVDEEDSSPGSGRVHILREMEKLESAGGSYEASHPGELTLTFDNRHSWMSKKTIHYYFKATHIEQKHLLDSPRSKRRNKFTNC